MQNLETIVYTPPAPLSAFVAHIWYSRAGAYNLSGISFPILHPEWIFNFDTDFSIRTTSNQPLLERSGGWISGLQTRALRVTTRGRHELAGVLFKPWGLAALPGIPVAELGNATIDSEAIFGSAVTELAGELRDATDGREKIRRLERFLLRQYAGKRVPPYIPEAVRRLETGEHNVTAVAECLNLSPKSLIQAFHKSIGITPYQVFQLYQLRNTLTDLVSHPRQKLTELTYRHHFFDQPHFTRFFRTYTTLTPSQYQQKIGQGLVKLEAPNFVETED